MPDEAAAAKEGFDVRVDHLLQCACETARALTNALRKVRSLRLGEPAPAATLESSPRFVVIESA